jgi:hypothetical protein
MFIRKFHICQKSSVWMVFTVVAVLIVSSCVQTAHAFVNLISLEDLVHESDLIIIGKVKCIGSCWSDDNSMIVTNAQVEPSLILKGSHPGKLTVQYRGGNVDGIEMRYSEAVTLSQGENVLLFLKKTGNGGYRVYGWYQGKYTITSRNGSMVVNNPLHAGCGVVTESGALSHCKDILLNEFLARIRQVM